MFCIDNLIKNEKRRDTHLTNHVRVQLQWIQQ